MIIIIFTLINLVAIIFTYLGVRRIIYCIDGVNQNQKTILNNQYKILLKEKPKKESILLRNLDKK